MSPSIIARVRLFARGVNDFAPLDADDVLVSTARSTVP